MLSSSFSDGNNNGESRAKKKSAVNMNIEGRSVDRGEKRLSLIKGKGGQSKLFFR